jgi:hypothetical protein
VPANHNVSVAWQIVFTFLPVLNLWAFYRIRKLRKYVLYIIVPSIAFSLVTLAVFFQYLFPCFGDECIYYSEQISTVRDSGGIDPFLYIITQVAGWTWQGFAIYLVIIWSRAYNRSFEQSSSMRSEGQH